MATIRKDTISRGHGKGRTVYRVQVYVKGQRESGTFDTKDEARAWASQREHELRTQARTGTNLNKTFGEAMRRYAREHSPKKAGCKWEQIRLTALENIEVGGRRLGEFKLCEFNASHYAAFRDERLKQVTGSTVNREMNLLSHVFTIARKEWQWIKESPSKDVSRPKQADPRQRRISDDEIARVTTALGFNGGFAVTQPQRAAVAFLFAIETAMRAGEIRNLQRGKPQEAGACYLKSANVAHLGKTKNSHPRDVPLSARARELVGLLPLTGLDLFGLGSAVQLASIFRRAVKRIGIEDLHFHDTRHEAISRLAQTLKILDLARMTGHRDLNELMTYYHSDAEELAKLMGAER